MRKNDASFETESLREAIEVRYGKDLYHSFERSNIYHFAYAYKRFLIEIVKTLLGLLKPRPVLLVTTALGLYSTQNQHKALLNAVSAGYVDSLLIPLDRLSRRAMMIRLLVWLAKPFAYPFYFVRSRHRPALYQTCLLYGMQTYARAYVDKLEKLGVEKLYISNDHAGDIYLLSLLIRRNLGIAVDYVQHGAVQPTFPVNYFHNIYVYSEKYAEIYRTLAQNPDVCIIVDPVLAGAVSEDLPRLDLLICFSHQFPIGPSIALMRALSNVKDVSAAARFHPSDRFAKFKLVLLRLFHPVQFSDPTVNYMADFSRAKWVVCASSSLLPDAVDKGFGPRLIWARQLGLKWDYYGLQGKVREVSDATEVTQILTCA